MSLNGLDAAQIKEAHDAVANEPRGWFVLKYASRDEIELLGHGTGGIAEARNAISQYDETSPLYGFLRYRRRKVIMKYLPEGCSRLIQARVAVHFTAVCEHFSPYDTTFEISVAEELKDTKLSAACSLHAASASTSSSNSSLRRRRLMEIAEEDEEEPRAAKRKSTVLENAAEPEATAPAEPQPEPVTLNAELATSPDQSKFAADTTSEVPNFVGIDDRPTSPTEAEGRSSTQSARPDMYSYSAYPYSRPKVKLGPRPSLDTISRPQTAGNFRPVSAIPAGFKLFGKGGQKKPRNHDEHESLTTTLEAEFATPSPATTEELPKLNTDLRRPSTSSGVSIKSINTLSTPVKPTMTPEKARLMKAMKLRAQKKKNAEVATIPNDGATIPENAEEEAKTVSVGDAETDPTVGEEPSAKEESKDEPISESATQAPGALNTEKDELEVASGIGALDQGDVASEQTQPDSRSQSPAFASELEQSTKASSLSESTNETAQPPIEQDLEQEKEDKKEMAHEPTEAVVAGEDAADHAKQELHTEQIAQNQDKVSETQQESLEKTGPTPTGSAVVESAPLEEPEINSAVPKLEDETSPATEANKPADAIMGVEDTPLKPLLSAATPDAAALDSAVESGSVEPIVPEQSHSAEAKVESEDVAQSFMPFNDSSRELPGQDVPETPKDLVTPIKSKPAIMTIRTDLAQAHSRQQSVAQSEAHLSDDEELMDELQSATVQEATPITVAKTPVSSAFPISAKSVFPPSPAGSLHTVRTVSNPIRGNLITPGDVSQSSARSVSSSGAALLHKVTQQPSPSNLAKKAVGSSISQRIKALEQRSATAGPELAVPAVSRDRPSSSFFNVNKNREPSRSSSVLDRASSFTRSSPQPTSTSTSRDPSPGEVMERHRDRSRSVATRLSMFETTPPHHTNLASNSSPQQRPRGRPESISVSAKIIRDPEHSMLNILKAPKDPSEYQYLDLKQSPLVVDHQRAEAQDTTPPVEEVMSDRRMSRESMRSELQEADSNGTPRRSSFNRVREFIKDRRRSITSSSGEGLIPRLPSPAARSPTRPPSAHTNTTTLTQRLTMSGRRSLSKDRDLILPRSYTEGSISSDDARSNSSDNKAKSRTGRFMRRLSTLSGSGPRSKGTTPPGMSPALPEEDYIPDTRADEFKSVPSTPAIVADLGDCNVQFPDSLLWKRRHMSMDATGYLILSALPAHGARPAAGTKRYHLSEFRQPCIPDLEVQELPNSVVLDLVEGGGVQIACEDRSGQMKVLEALRDAHALHAAA